MRQIGGAKVDHSPAPWKRRKGTSVIAGPRGDSICVVVGTMVGGEFRSKAPEANARLIEAAPDMLQALGFWVEEFDDTYDGERPLKSWEHALMKSYQKATGQ